MAYFRIKTPVTNDAELSVPRPDMFIGQEPTIRIGGANDISRGLFEASIAETPSFGDADLLFCTLHSKMQNLETFNAKFNLELSYINYRRPYHFWIILKDI